MPDEIAIGQWVDEVLGRITLLQKTELKERADRAYRTQYGKAPSQMELKIGIYNVLHNLAGRHNVGTRPSEIAIAIAKGIIKF